MKIQSKRLLPTLVGSLLTALTAACGTAAPEPASGPEPERVNLGYGTQSSDNVTGAVGSLTDEDLERPGATTLVAMLQDRLPGVQVVRMANGDLSVRIRGTRSLLGGNEPLFVIDGTPLLGGRGVYALASIAPQDVQRIDVLKDAGSTAAYGSRGANGVILVTTRRGR